MTLIHFETQQQLDTWATSDEHTSLIAEVQAITAASRHRKAEGLEIWFSVPETSRAANPSYWKQVLISAPAVFLLILGLGAALAPLIDDMPTLPATAISVTLTTMVLTWPVMPWLTRAFQGFLYPPESR